MLVNHFLDKNLSGILIPNRDAADITNSATSIMAQSNICTGLYGRSPNFILVSTPVMPQVYVFPDILQLDWMSVGDGMPVQAAMNGLKFVPSVTNTTAGTAQSPNATNTASGGAAAETAQVRKRKIKAVGCFVQQNSDRDHHRLPSQSQASSLVRSRASLLNLRHLLLLLCCF